MDIKVKATYSLEKEKENTVMGECCGYLAVAYYNDNGKSDVITKVVVEYISERDVTFSYLDNGDIITIPIDKIIDWIEQV